MAREDDFHLLELSDASLERGLELAIREFLDLDRTMLGGAVLFPDPEVRCAGLHSLDQDGIGGGAAANDAASQRIAQETGNPEQSLLARDEDERRPFLRLRALLRQNGDHR